MTISVSWRNVWRSKTRSLVILFAIALGIFTGIFNGAFYNGMANQRINSAIATEASHLQLHNKGYTTDPEEKNFIPNASSVANEIAAMDTVKAVCTRFIVQGMIQSPTTSTGIKVFGIQPEIEKTVTNIHTHLVDGDYFGETKRNQLIIGHKLAQKLKIKLRSKVVITFADSSGYLSGASFRVSGIYQTSNNQYDEMNVFVRASDLCPLYGVDTTNAHEIAVLLDHPDAVQSTVQKLQEDFPKLDVEDWRQLLPSVAILESSLDISMYIFMIIILLALAFGIVNTMLMAVLERTKELGMLMAIGMTKVRIFKMIMSETIILSLVGGIVGIFLGVVISAITAKTGIDISIVSEGIGALGYDSTVYPYLKTRDIIMVVILVFITGMLASIYPAIKALKLKPAEAIRIDM